MKKQLFTIFLFGLLLPVMAYSFINSFSSLEINETDPIDLKGKTEPPDEIRSAKIASPITAEKQGNVVFAMFHDRLGDIQITITDDMGNEVFFQIVNTTAQPQITIPLFGLPNGIYTIIFNNQQVELYGDFEI